MQQVCRTCLATHGELVPIFTNNYYVHNLPAKLKHTIRIEVSKDDDLPQMMCKKCVFLVDSLCCFKDQCEMSEVKLKKTLLKNQSNNTKKSPKNRDLNLTEFDSNGEEAYSDALSSEDEYHIEYVSEEARLAVEGAKRSRRNAKKSRGLKVKSVEILPNESKNNSFKNKIDISALNEEMNITDSDISSSFYLPEEPKKPPVKKKRPVGRPRKDSKPGFKRKIPPVDNNSYNQLAKVPKKVMFKETEYDDENTQYIAVTENPIPPIVSQKDLKPSERTLPSTRIDSTMFRKNNRNFNLPSLNISNNSMLSPEKPKPLVETDSKKIFETRMKSLVNHVVLNNPKSCTICSDSFDTYLGVLKHKISMHLNPDEQCFYCPICQEKFFSHQNLVKHLDDHKDIVRSFMCVLCSDNFYTEEMLRSHLATHVNLEELRCIPCKMKFERVPNLLSHMDVHINKQLVCTFCIDSFDSKDALQTHINEEHELSLENSKAVIPQPIEKKKITRFTCSHCDRMFASATAVREHELQKHPEFACLICDKKFASQDERNDHTKECHMKPDQSAEAPTVDRKKFLCRVCHEILISRAAYSQHLKEKHCNSSQTNEMPKEQTEISQSEQPTQNESNPLPASETT